MTRFRILGPLEVQTEQGWTSIGASKWRAALACLLLNAGQIVSTDTLIDELKQADVIVLGLPMYNFGVPSQLKSYFDHIARAGVTFKYTEKGPVGQLTGKKVYVFAARGGLYAGTPLDTQTSYVRDFLRFIGMTDVEFVYAEGLAISPQSKEAGLAKAAAEIARLAA